MKDYARFFKVLADEARVAMVWLLMNHEELCVCDFMAVLEITQSKASRHLRILYAAGIVSDRRDGAWVHYKLCPPADAFVRAQLAALKKALGITTEAQELLARCKIHRGKGETCPTHQ